MSEDLTKKLRMTDSEKQILTAVQNLDMHVRSSIQSLVTWVGNIDSRLQRLEQKVEQRLYDTRPIWHKVVADIAQLQSGQQRLEQNLDKVRVEVSEVRRDQIVLNDSILDAPPSISYTAKRFDYSARGGESIAAYCSRRSS
jgi:esterase/lipase